MCRIIWWRKIIYSLKGCSPFSLSLYSVPLLLTQSTIEKADDSQEKFFNTKELQKRTKIFLLSNL
jgi:hypothetical protein